jgi:hypothetical protein
MDVPLTICIYSECATTTQSKKLGSEEVQILLTNASGPRERELTALGINIKSAIVVRGLAGIRPATSHLRQAEKF